ncbi:MAG: phage baseplate protein [Blastocatellia bacterium]
MNLLAAACSGTSREALARLSVGKRDAHLLTLREWMFGPRMVSIASCLNCGERLELTFNAADLHVMAETESAETLSLDVDEYELRFRLPDSTDLAALEDCRGGVAARQLLLGRCISAAKHKGEQVAIDRLPPGVVDAVAEHMAQADPQANLQLALSCPACDFQWQALFDIESFLWSEINAWANRTLKEVHALASAYGWREIDILNMSPLRRQAYLNLVSG